jgi:hypothetical protein
VRNGSWGYKTRLVAKARVFRLTLGHLGLGGFFFPGGKASKRDLGHRDPLPVSGNSSLAAGHDGLVPGYAENEDVVSLERGPSSSSLPRPDFSFLKDKKFENLE